MRKKCFNTYLCCIIFSLSFFLISELAANEFNRKFEVVVVPGNHFGDFKGAPLGNSGELFLFKYDSQAREWKQIPFQIDEKHSSGDFIYDNWHVVDNIAGLDENDELAFLAGDAGARNDFSWIDDLDSYNYKRYEIEVTDPITDAKTYAYLYRSTTIKADQGLTDYVKLIKSQTGKISDDTVESSFYTMVNLTNGLPGGLIIPKSAGGSGNNIMDRMKLRIKGSTSYGDAKLSESSLKFSRSRGDTILSVDGPIRVIRKLDGTLEAKILFITIKENFTGVSTIFEPYSTFLRLDLPDISQISFSYARMSIDFNANASGMLFTSAKNLTPVTIDGVTDESIDRALDETVLPDGNWLCYESTDQTEATVVNLFPTDLTTGGNRELYYKDRSSKDDNDTGDERSYGDAGIYVSGGINTPAKLEYKGWFLDSKVVSAPLVASNTNQAVSKISGAGGNQVAMWEKNSLEVATTPQDLSSVPVELIAFRAEVEGNAVALSWHTASESDNFGFDIELRGADEDWEKVGFVAGNGTTVQPKSYYFKLEDLQPGEYGFRLKQIDTDGAFDYSNVVSAFISVPSTFVLAQNFPNPFNPTTTISFQVPEIADGSVDITSLKIYNLLGKEIVTLVDEYKAPGSYSIIWNARDKNGLSVPSGIYLYRLKSGRHVAMKKMILVK